MKDGKKKDTKSYRLARRTGVLLGYIVVYMLLFWITIIGCRKAYSFCYEVFGSVAIQEEPGSDISFQVEAADTIESVSRRLEEEHLIVNRYSFRARVHLLNESDNTLKPGIYVLNNSMNYQEIIDQIMVTEGITE